MSEERPISKYAAKAGSRYRYSFEGCEHQTTYLDRYSVVSSPGGDPTNYVCKRCGNCNVILGQPWIDYRRRP